MAFQVKKAKREKIYPKIAIIAPSGGGKTYGALRLATGMAEEIEKETGKKAKILMGNTESKRGYYYANEFDYDIADVDAPYNPEKFVELIDFAVSEGYDDIVLTYCNTARKYLPYKIDLKYKILKNKNHFETIDEAYEYSEFWDWLFMD